MISYILALIISFAGVILGGVLALIAPEELKAGEKWWKILEWGLLAIIVTVMLYFAGLTAWTIVLAAVLFALKFVKNEYPALIFVLVISLFFNFLFLASALIFIYGFPKGTLDAKKVVNMKKHEIAKTILYVFKKNLLYLIFGFVLLPLLLAYA